MVSPHARQTRSISAIVQSACGFARIRSRRSAALIAWSRRGGGSGLCRLAHPAGIGQGLDAGGDVDAVAVEVVALDDHIAEIDANAQFDAVVRRGADVALRHP